MGGSKVSSRGNSVIWRYIITHDGGLAPHILNGMCSLTVCKPVIRRYAIPGEWIVAFVRASKSRGRPLVQYAMKVADNPSFEEYCRENMGLRRDAIYRYDSESKGVWFDNGYRDHDPTNGDAGLKDKGGKHALISTVFVHFGSEPMDLQFALMPLCDKRGLCTESVVSELFHRTQGQSKFCSREAYEVFVEWIENLPRDRSTPGHHSPFPKLSAANLRLGKSARCH